MKREEYTAWQELMLAAIMNSNCEYSTDRLGWMELEARTKQVSEARCKFRILTVFPL